MSRPLRIEYPGAFYHLTARGNDQAKIYFDDEDRCRFLQLLAQEITQQRWVCYAYCLMDNHYHLLVETPEANLVTGMRRLNGVYTQGFNRRHGHVGHVFQGRYKSILVEKDSYLLVLARYIALNPVRAGMIETPSSYRWSSYRSCAGLDEAPQWLASKQLLEHFGSREAYVDFVTDEMNIVSIWDELQGQIWLGSESFRENMKQRVPQYGIANIPKCQLNPDRPNAETVLPIVADYFSCEINDVISRSHKKAYILAVYLLRRVVNMPLRKVAGLFCISTSRVSQVQKRILDGEFENEASVLLEKCKLKN
ncbi:MAG: transposase [Mariprofundaceae bacterium]